MSARICLLKNELAFSFSFVVPSRVNRRAQNTFRVEINLDAHQHQPTVARRVCAIGRRYVCRRRVIFSTAREWNPLILGLLEKNSVRERRTKKRTKMDANALVGQCWLRKRNSQLNQAAQLWRAPVSWRSLFFLKARRAEIFITNLSKLTKDFDQF